MTTQGVTERVPEWTLGDRLRKARTLTDMTTREFALLSRALREGWTPLLATCLRSAQS